MVIYYEHVIALTLPPISRLIATREDKIGQKNLNNNAIIMKEIEP